MINLALILVVLYLIVAIRAMKKINGQIGRLYIEMDNLNNDLEAFRQELGY